MLLYLLTCFPFEDGKNNGLNVYNECVLIVAFIAVLVMTSRDFPAAAVSLVGWLLIGLVAVSLIATWVIILPPSLKALLRTVSDWCKGETRAETEQKCRDPNKGIAGEVPKKEEYMARLRKRRSGSRIPLPSIDPGEESGGRLPPNAELKRVEEAPKIRIRRKRKVNLKSIANLGVGSQDG